MREISKLLAKTGAVTGKGESIEKANKDKRVKMVDTVTQVDSVTIELEVSCCTDKARRGELTGAGAISFSR